MINTPINDKEFVRLQVQGATEFGEAWYMMNRYLVVLAKPYGVHHVRFSMGLVRMALKALRDCKINFTAQDFLDMVLSETVETTSRAMPMPKPLPPAVAKMFQQFDQTLETATRLIEQYAQNPHQRQDLSVQGGQRRLHRDRQVPDQRESNVQQHGNNRP